MLCRPIFAFCQQWWREILNIQVTMMADRVRILERGSDSDLTLHGWLADYPDPHNFLIDFSVDHWTNWRNDDFERLLEQAQLVGDPQERIKLFSRADRLLVEESVILPLCYRVRSQLIKPWVSHYDLNALAQLRLQDVILHPH